MLAELAPVPEQTKRITRLTELVDLDSRLRPFSCPTGLHDFCSNGSVHFPLTETGLTG